MLSTARLSAPKDNAAARYQGRAGKFRLSQIMPINSSASFPVTRLLDPAGLFVMFNLYRKILAERSALTALIIDRDERRQSIALTLQNAGFRIIEAAESSDGLHYLQDSAPSLVILGEDMPPVDNLELLTALRDLTTVPIVVMGSSNQGSLTRALIKGADVYLDRAVSARVFLARIHAAIRRYDLSEGFNMGALY